MMLWTCFLEHLLYINQLASCMLIIVVFIITVTGTGSGKYGCEDLRSAECTETQQFALVHVLCK